MTTKEAYKFIVDEYIRILKIALDRGYTVSTQALKILDYVEELEKRAKADISYFDPIENATCRIYGELAHGDPREQDRKILSALGITASPEKVLWTERLCETVKTGYVVHFTDDVTDRARHEPVWVNGDATEKQVLERARVQFQGVFNPIAGLRIETDKMQYTEILYTYRSRLFTERK